MKRFITTCIDPATHIAFAFAHTSSTSRNACALLVAIHDNFLYLKSAHVLTDNGSEFKGDFAKHVTVKSITHWRTYPKTPKMNAHCERFNQKLADWLVQYHTLIPHFATKPQPRKSTSKNNLPTTPLQCLLKSNPQCNMYWTNTPV